MSRGHERSGLELDRIISRLDDTFALQLRKPKYRERQLSDEEARDEQRRVDDIHQRIRLLHYHGDDRLAACLGRFEQQGRLILTDAASCSTTRHLSAAIRALLQERLLRILCDVDGVESRQWSKRVSEDMAEYSAKRARGRLSDSYDHHDAVDALPVCSRDSFSGSDVSMTSKARSMYVEDDLQPPPPPPPQQPRYDRSFVSSRTSFQSEVSSEKPTQDESFISQTTIDSSYPDKAYDYPLSQQTTVESFSHSFNVGQSRDNFQPAENSLPHRPNKSKEKREHEPSQSENLVDGNGEAIEDRLASIWPKLPHPELTQAPLAVIWEITRAALHCKVSLEQFDLLYEPNDKWHDQTSLREIISGHPLFHGKSLPPSSNSAAWSIALADFQTKSKTVMLSAELVYNQDGGPLYSLRLQPLGLELGHRLARRFGADRFLEILIPSPSESSDGDPKVLKEAKSLEKIVDWLTKSRHYFLGRSWKPFFVRDVKGKKKISSTTRSTRQDRIYLFACDGNNFRSPSIPDGIPPLEEALETRRRTKMKLSGLLKWALDVGNERNAQQPIPKLFSRLALSKFRYPLSHSEDRCRSYQRLGLSRTWPTVVLEKEQILDRCKDLGHEKVMNDGIGRISPSLAKKVAEALGLSDCPSCFQGRLGSAKGMWLIDVESDDERDWVEIYPSQNKWECDFDDPHHRTLEIRNWPSELRSASLNQQFIPVLEAQSPEPNVMRRVMAEHLGRALHADLGEQAAAMKDPMSLRLWIHQSRPSKTDRLPDGSAFFLAGLPDNSADKVAFLLDSGFDQRKLEYLQDIVWDMCKKKADVLKTKMNITIPCSAYIYMAADFTSTLEEDEVHLSFSTKFQAEGFSDTLLEDMDILVARAPAHLPSDIQRVKVVSRPELRKLKDVIIFSTKGRDPLADKLSGGDYDGDLAWVCWDQNIVKNFSNALVPKKPDLIQSGYLRKMGTQFKSILDEVESNNYYKYRSNRSELLEDACADFISRAFLFNLQPSFLGRCTKYKERLCYAHNSVKDRAATDLSHLLGYLVDQSKQGIEFTQEDWHRFVKVHLGKKSIFLNEPEYAKEKGTRLPDQRGQLHILDYLRFDVAEKVIDEVLTSLNDSIKENDEKVQNYDSDLTKLINLYEEQATTSSGCRQLLTYLKRSITALSDEWRVISRDGYENSKYADNVEDLYQKWLDIQPPPELLLSGEFPALLHDASKDSALSNWQLLKASTTFKNHYKGVKFVWNMAGKQLAYLKAMARSDSGETSKVLVIPEMWGVLRPDKKLITSLAMQRETARDSESALALEEVFEFDDNGTVIDDA
ncbi:putative RNA-dependent RNA polymerase SHL2 [Trichoderma ghanense]|uniref:RNA-dependent RNA polymerase n=1 Tax=Trichoderma ghanense TaxID=65468 RepID=A0ABY2GS97_9HYPO